MKSLEVNIVINPKGQILPWTAHHVDLCCICQFLEGESGREGQEYMEEWTWKNYEAQGYKLVRAEIKLL